MSDQFPPNDMTGEPTNPAIRIYGRRFHSGQTPVEYLAEFLLVFASSKGDSATRSHAFELTLGENLNRAIYWPEDRIALKLFTFFPTSKLDTRHDIHQKAYRQALDNLQEHIDGSNSEKDETIRLLQSLFSGFVGVAKNRTWVTCSFLPVSTSLLARELDWLHSKASKTSKIATWNDAGEYFVADRHNFMARGGELLFLQLAHLFSNHSSVIIEDISGNYSHIQNLSLLDLKSQTEKSLLSMLDSEILSLNALSAFIDKSLNDFRWPKKERYASLGWVPISTLPESLLFAYELHNLVTSTLNNLEKLKLMQTLCCMQVLRTLCFIASREDAHSNSIQGFIGNYAWIATNPNAPIGVGTRKLAENSFDQIEAMLFRVLRKKALTDSQAQGSMREAHKHGFEIFRKIAKQLEFVIPFTGRGQRFVLPSHLLCFFVVSLLAPGERIRLTRFYERVFAHYGIALGERQLAAALAWSGQQSDSRDYAVAADTHWIEETLRQGGFLVELSDAVSIVHNSTGHRQTHSACDQDAN
ncbi:hypothetical protein CKO09_02240 [Chromatium weissei]|nr:hypothetical protein [Chromatium weissei]